MVWKVAKDGETQLRGTLLEDGKTRTRGWNAARWWRNANSWLQDLKHCKKELEMLLEDDETQTPARKTLKHCSKTSWLHIYPTATRQHPTHLLKYYPRPPCAPSLNKSRFFSHTTIYLLTSLHFWNSLYVYTRGILGCLLGFWPLGQNPAGAKRTCWIFQADLVLIKMGLYWPNSVWCS